MKIKREVTYTDWTRHKDGSCSTNHYCALVTIEIDEDRLFNAIGPKAMLSKRSKSQVMCGIIRAHSGPVQTAVSTTPARDPIRSNLPAK